MKRKDFAIALILSLSCWAAQAAAEINDLTEPSDVNVVSVEGAIKGEKYTVCLIATGAEIKFTPRPNEPQSAKMCRVAATLKAFGKQLKEQEEDAADAAKKAAKSKPKEPAPNAKPIPKTSKDTAWYSERTDDLIMVCPLPKLPRAEIVDTSAISQK